VEITNADKPDLSVTVKLDAGASEEENVRIVVLECEKTIYPTLVHSYEEPEPVDPEEVLRRVSSGVPLVEAMISNKKRVIEKRFRVSRIGINNNTIVLKSDGEQLIYELLFMPVFKFIELLNTKYTPETAYEYLIKNSQPYLINGG